MTIRTALDRIVTLQQGLTISDPISDATGQAYKYPPRPQDELDFPAWINVPELIATKIGNALRERIYLVRMQLLVKDSDRDRAGDIAMAYQEALAVALESDVTLNGAATLWRNYRGGLKSLSWNGLEYPGLDMQLEVILGVEAAVLAA